MDDFEDEFQASHNVAERVSVSTHRASLGNFVTEATVDTKCVVDISADTQREAAANHKEALREIGHWVAALSEGVVIRGHVAAAGTEHFSKFASYEDTRHVWITACGNVFSQEEPAGVQTVRCIICLGTEPWPLAEL